MQFLVISKFPFMALKLFSRWDLGGTESTILDGESSDSESCASKVAFSIDRNAIRMAILNRFSFILLFCDSTHLFCFWLQNLWRLQAHDSGNRAIRDSMPLRLGYTGKRGSRPFLSCFHASFFPFRPLCWPPLFLPFPRRLLALFSLSKSALFRSAKGTAHSLERGSFRMDRSGRNPFPKSAF